MKGSFGMSVLKNLKIRSKLFVGFGLLLAVTSFIAIFGAVQISNVSGDYDHAINFILERRSILRDMEVTMMDARRTMNRASMHASDVYGDGSDEAANAAFRNIGITNQENLIRELRAEMLQLFADFRTNVNNDSRISDEMIATQNARISGLEAAALHYFDYYILDRIMSAARAGDTATAVAVTTQAGGAGGTVPVILGYFDQIREGINETLNRTLQELSHTRSYTFTIMIVLAIAGLVLGIAIAIIISSLVSKPIIEVSEVINSVSQGNFNINFRNDLSNDETGVMTRDVYSLVDVIKSIVDDLNNTHKQYIQLGNTHFNIDDTKYQNSFKDMIGQVNSLISQVTADIENVAENLNSIGDGNFNVEVDHDVWVGEWVVIPNALSNLTTNLKGVSSEVNAMIEAAAVKGDLSFKTDAAKYKGDWQKIMVGLNDIAKAVDTPINVIDICLNEMKSGNFDLDNINSIIAEKNLSVNADDFAGSFKTIIAAVDESLIAIASYITDINEVSSRISNGDLTTTITREYAGSFAPIKESLNNITKTLNKTISEISASSEQVLSGARQISTSAQDLANGAQEQASSIQQLTASIDMISTQTKQNSENAQEANTLSNESTRNAQEGNVAMKQMLESMEQIKESSNNISRVNKAIQDIAFQTNLLALNAAVEAARAGDAGKGFAVVAEEVRNLAARSQQASTETTGMIEDSISRVDTGSGIAETTAEALTVIVDSAEEVLQLINKISDSSKEQADAVNQVSVGVNQISSVVQSNSAVSEETAAAAEELNSQAEVLQQLVSYFKV